MGPGAIAVVAGIGRSSLTCSVDSGIVFVFEVRCEDRKPSACRSCVAVDAAS